MCVSIHSKKGKNFDKADPDTLDDSIDNLILTIVLPMIIAIVTVTAMIDNHI